MIKLQTKKKVTLLAVLFTVTYMVSYLTRINYGAIISEMEADTQIARSLLSMALTGSFITYGAGQIISGICGDRFGTKKLITCGLILTILMNLLIPVCGNPYLMLAVWCVNGFAQSFMWPPLVRSMAALLSDEDYKSTTVKVNWGGSLGTMFIYLVAPIIISLFSWRMVFVFCALCGVIMLLFWLKFAPNVPPEPKCEEAQKRGNMRSLFSPIMICIMIAIAMQGALRDGITTWMPSYISETYNLSSVISILTGVILPIFAILSLNATSLLYRKKFTNPLACASVVFALGAVSALALYFFTGASAILSIIFSALLTASMHGVNLILVCMLPAYFKSSGNVSTASGVLNSCTYIGSAISTYGIALVSENHGWDLTILLWLAIATFGTVLCLSCIKSWRKRSN